MSRQRSPAAKDALPRIEDRKEGPDVVFRSNRGLTLGRCCGFSGQGVPIFGNAAYEFGRQSFPRRSDSPTMAEAGSSIALGQSSTVAGTPRSPSLTAPKIGVAGIVRCFRSHTHFQPFRSASIEPPTHAGSDHGIHDALLGTNDRRVNRSRKCYYKGRCFRSRNLVKVSRPGSA